MVRAADNKPPDRASSQRSDAHSRAQLVVALRWPLALVAALVVAALAGWLIYRETLDATARAAGAAGSLAGAAADRLEAVASRLLTGDVTETFLAAIPQIDSDAGGRLELARARSTEIFTRSDQRRVLFDLLSLGTTATEIRVPVTYRYHLRLDEPWRVEVRDRLCLVYAPPIRPTLPPAIHTDRMEKRVDEGWLRFDGEEQLAELERSLTPRLVVLARDQRHLDLVREESRKAVASFVRRWLLRESQWGEERVRAVKVVFPDEVELDPERIGASVVFGDDG